MPNTKTGTDKEIQAMIWNALSETPVTRFQLQWRTGLTDRTIRAAIHDLRITGHPICYTEQWGGGYYKPTKRSQLEAFVAKELARIRSLEEIVGPAILALQEWEEDK